MRIMSVICVKLSYENKCHFYHSDRAVWESKFFNLPSRKSSATKQATLRWKERNLADAVLASGVAS
jgi:hypothetical protein